MSLLPSEPDTAAADDAEPRVVGVESDDADELIGALSSTTARRLLCELHENPAPPAELADRVDTSLQNVQYHLEKLEAAGAVTVVDTAYSQKGREMDVYAPADRPLVIFAGDDDTTSIRTVLTRLLGGFAALAFASAAVQYRFGDGLGGLFGGDGTAPGVGGPTPTPTPGEAAPARTPTPDGGATATNLATETVVRTTEAAASADATAALPPGLLFFLGGATVLLAALAIWYVGQ
jgi:DNA-binding transcriptional ArsR family regulator